MSMRSVDLQAVVFRMHEVERLQQILQQQPSVLQGQFARAFVEHSEVVRRQVQTNFRAEPTKIREEERSRQERSGGRRSPRQGKGQGTEREVSQPSYETAQDPPTAIDFRA